MASPLNPLTRPHLDKLAGLAEPGFALGEEEHEARAQILLNEWLKFYFSGVPFDSRAAGGAVQSRTFPDCDLLFDNDSPEQPVPKPLIHVLLLDRRVVREGGVGDLGVGVTEERWVYNLLVRTPGQFAAGEAGARDASVAESNRINRRIASQLMWLLRGTEAHALVEKGLGHIDPTPPRLIASGSWCLRQLAFTARVFIRTVIE